MRAGGSYGWSVGGLLTGVLVGLVPSEGWVNGPTGLAVSAAALVLVLLLAARPVGARIAAFASGVLLAVPCHVSAPPLGRFLVACAAAGPFLAAGALVRVPTLPGIRSRLAYLMTWCGTRPIARRVRRFEGGAAFRLLVAAALLAVVVALLRVKPGGPMEWAIRWLSGASGIGAFAEIVTAGFALTSAALGIAIPALMDSPHLSASIAEFWNRRWNPFASRRFFLPLCFEPLARHGTALAVWATFAVSGIGHALVTWLALGDWVMAAACGGFFVLQPVLLALERRLRVRRWRSPAGRLWTLGLLVISSPLIVEPGLRLVEASWGSTPPVLASTAAMVVGVMTVAVLVSGLSLLALPPARAAGATTPRAPA